MNVIFKNFNWRENMIYAPLKLVKNVVPEIPELLDFIDKLNPELAEGKINIKNDDIFAITASYHTRKLSELVLESHQQYIDIQIVLKGEEKVMVSYADDLIIKEKSSERDLIFYHKPAKFAAELYLKPGVFAVFFDFDIHLTQLNSYQEQEVKKTVIKLKKIFWE